MERDPDDRDAPWPGVLLRSARVQQGLSVEECARRLRARPRQLSALEEGDLSSFGGDVYVRGFLRTYAGILSVDPDEVLRLHGQDPSFNGPVLAPREPLRIRRSPPGWVLGLVGVIAVAGVLLAVLGFGGRRAPEAVVPVDATDGGTSAVTEQSAPAPQPPAEPPVQERPVAPPVDVVLTFEASSWLEVLVDDVLVESGALVPPGETLRFSGQRAVALRLGNAGGVRVELNGESLGPPGRPGEVLRLVLGPDGTVDPSAQETATDG